MPKKKMDEYPTSAAKEDTLKYLQDTFVNRVDPDVVYFILSERDYDLDSTLQALLTISNENYEPCVEEQQHPELDPQPPQPENNCGEILRLSEILNSEVKPPVCCTSPETCRLRPSSPSYRSDEALYTVEHPADKTTAVSFAQDYAQPSDKPSPSPDRQCTTHAPPETKTSTTNATISIVEKKNDLNEAVSPQSDNRVEPDADSAVIRVPSPTHEPRKDEKHFNPSEMGDSIPLATCAQNRPFYYFPFVSAKATPLHQFPFPQPRKQSNFSSPKFQARGIESRAVLQLPPVMARGQPSNLLSPKTQPRAIERPRRSSPVDRLLEIQRTEDKLVVLLRGLPGSGKSTLASKLAAENGVICSSDYYFTHRGKYTFDPARLGEAHEWNQRRARKFMEEGKPLIVIDNTNVEAWEMKPYVMFAQRYGYRVEILEPDTPWRFKPNELALRNVHGVSRDRIQIMLDRYDRNLTVGAVLAKAFDSAAKRGGGLQSDTDPSVDEDLQDVISWCSPDDGLSDRTTRSSSYCDSPRISPSREFKPVRPAKFSNSSESVSPTSPPLSPSRSVRSPVKKDTKVYVDNVNLNRQSSKIAKHVDKWPRKPETHGDGLPKVPHTSTRTHRKAAAMTGPKPMSAVTSSTGNKMTSRDMRCQTKSPVRDVLFRKNALDSLKDDYVNEDDEFWCPDERRKSPRAKDRSPSPQRGRYRARQSKGDARAMEEIARANVVEHDITLAGSEECCDDLERKAEEPRPEENPPPVRKRTKTKIASSFAFPFVQYSGRWCVPDEPKCESVDSVAQVNERDVFLMSQCATGYKCLVPRSRDICGDLPPEERQLAALDKTTWTENASSELRELFPNVSEVSLAKLIAKCEGDVEWASNLLLDLNNEGDGARKGVKPDPKTPKLPLGSHVNAAIDEALNLIDRGAAPATGDSRLQDAATETTLADPARVEAEEATRDSPPARLDAERKFEEDELVFQLEPAFALQLEQLFGPPSHSEQSRAHSLEIKINLNLAWQIHKCWAKSVQKKLCEEDCEFVRRLEEEEGPPRRGVAVRHKRSLSLDRKRSRSCDLGDSRHHPHRIEKTDSVPNMRDIMDLEMALQMTREDATEQVHGMWTDVDLATKMKRKLLYERYPFLDSTSLDEVFASNNFSLPQTEEQIQSAFGGEVPALGRNEVRATNSEVQRSGLVRKVSTMQSPILTPVLGEVQDFRAESVLYHQMRQECFTKAKEAYNSGRRGAASFYAQQGHAYTEKIWEANRHASLKILVHRNMGRDRNTIDLHLLYVREALEMLEIFLKIKLEELMNTNDRRVVINVITGRGKHSVDQVPRLKRGVINYLCKKNITYHEKQAGLIEVVLTRKEKL